MPFVFNNLICMSYSYFLARHSILSIAFTWVQGHVADFVRCSNDRTNPDKYDVFLLTSDFNRFQNFVIKMFILWTYEGKWNISRFMFFLIVHGETRLHKLWYEIRYCNVQLQKPHFLITPTYGYCLQSYLFIKHVHWHPFQVYKNLPWCENAQCERTQLMHGAESLLIWSKNPLKCLEPETSLVFIKARLRNNTSHESMCRELPIILTFNAHW